MQLAGPSAREGRPKNRPPHFASKVSYSAGAAKNRLIRTSAASAVQNPVFNTPKIAKRLVRNCRVKKCCIFSLKCLDVNNLIHNFVTQDRLHLGKAYKQASSFALGLHYLCPDGQDRLHLGKTYRCPETPTERRRTNCNSAVAEPIKTPNNEIFCPHNALHALPFSKASFRVC